MFVERPSNWFRSDCFNPLPIKIHCSLGIITVRCSYFISRYEKANSITEIGDADNPWLTILNENSGIDLRFPKFEDLKEVPLSSSCILHGTNVIERDFSEPAFADYLRSAFYAHIRHR